MTPREAYIGLNLMEKVGPVKVRTLQERFGSVEAIFEAGETSLRGVRGIGPKLAASIVAQIPKLDIAGEQKRAEKLGARIITRVDDEYPAPLAEIHDPPLALYVIGTLEERDKHAIAVVGSRSCSHYGRQSADRLGYSLGTVGYTVVSGLALGIDTAAHQGAVKSAGRTIAVLGSALDELYPETNKELAEQIAQKGAVISEFPLGTKPGRTTFPMRNRIITGLSMGVVVVEAGRKSGAMISADEAAAQGRVIFAVPGRIDNPKAQGCHMLIKNGAKLVEDVKDITDEFEYLFTPETLKPEAERPRPRLNETEEKIVALLEKGALDVDTLIREAGISPAKVSGILIGLEMKRMIRVLPGKMIELM